MKWRKNLSKVLKKAGETQAKWNTFWFEADSAQRIHLFRLIFGLTLFGFYLSRTVDLEFFYTDSGILHLNVIPEVVPTRFRFSVLDYFQGIFSLYFFHSLFLVSLLTMAFGIFPRISAGVALLLHLSFLHRNMTIAYGVDSISSFFLFCLIFSCSKIRKGALFESMALRFLQIQVCVIYAYSGLEKLRGVLWWKGEALWYALANYQIARFDFSWLAHAPLLIVFGTYSTLLWEIYFPVIVWIKPIRKYVLLFGIILHFGIAVTVQIPFFALLMISSYILFLDSKELIALSKIYKSLFQRLKTF
jgi:hypothetical protein